MHTNEEEEIKKEFQLERVILFTDAVFAIILTIMVLELKLPENIKSLNGDLLQDALKHLGIRFFAYALTFFIVAKFWIEHLRLFRYLKDYDANLLIYNLLFLFSVTLFPFAVSLISGMFEPNSSEFTLAISIYTAVIYSTVFFQSLISWYLLKNRDKLCIPTSLLEDNFKWKITRVNLFLAPLLIMTMFAFFYLQVPYYYPVFTAAIYGAVTGRMDKAYYPPEKKKPLITQLFSYIKSGRKKKPKAITTKKSD
jgi:uncharacterized membrane protein